MVEVLNEIDELEDGNALDRGELKNNLNIASVILGNKNITYSDLDYLTLYADEGKLWYQAIGDGHEMVLDVCGYDKGSGEVNIEYKRFSKVLSYMEPEVHLEFGEGNMDIGDGSAKATLASYHNDGVTLDRKEIKKRVKEAKKSGYKIDKSKFLEALVYLYDLRTRNAEDELMEDIYFTTKYSFIFDVRYVVRLKETTPIDFSLDSHTAGVLISFLTGLPGEEFYLNEREEDKFDFVIGDNYYGVSRVNRYIKNVEDTLEAFEPEEDMDVNLGEFLRYIELATVFLEDDQEDIVCKVEDGKGRILSDTIDNASDGTFTAEGVDELEIGMNALDILNVLGVLRGTVKDELKFQLNLTDEMAYFKHDKGDCLLTILDRG